MKSTMFRTGAVAMTGVALGAFSLQASALPPPPYAVFDIGRSSITMDPAGIDQAGIQSSVSNRHDTGFAITLGWRFSPVLAAEAAFIDLGEGKYAVAVDEGGPVSNMTVGVRSSGVLLSLAGTLPVHARLSLEVRAGTYVGRTETRVRGVAANPLVGNQTFTSLLGTDTKAGLAAGGGAVAAINESWAVRLGYDYLDNAFGTDARRISVGVRFNWP